MKRYFDADFRKKKKQVAASESYEHELNFHLELRYIQHSQISDINIEVKTPHHVLLLCLFVCLLFWSIATFLKFSLCTVSRHGSFSMVKVREILWL